MSQQKLTHLANSLELSINQLWANSNIWDQVMPKILFLIKILKKYSKYLVNTTNSMNKLHYSDESVCNPNNNSFIYQIAVCNHNSFKDNYIQLNDFLFERPFYEHVNI